MADLGNGTGIYVDSVGHNTIGGTAADQRNVISANRIDGVFMEGNTAAGNVVQGNYIGVDANGSGALGNYDFGVTLLYAPSNTVGGTLPGTVKARHT